MSWYKQVFTGETPSKQGPPIMRGLPRIIDKPFDEDELAKQQSRSELNFIFSNKFTMSGIPTNTEEATNFLNNKQSREDNPLQLPVDNFTAWNPAINVTKNIHNSIVEFIKYSYSYVDPIAWFTQKRKSVFGGGKTQKRTQRNARKSQRKNYSV
jgi:hypothetical protein